MLVRALQARVASHLESGKSLLFLGPRQTGKTTLAAHFDADITISLVDPGQRLRYEQQPGVLVEEIRYLAEHSGDKKTKKPLVVLDEIQKNPCLSDAVQYCVDQGWAQFIITGSSARQLRKSRQLNLLPGRIIVIQVDPLSLSELPDSWQSLEDNLNFGSLPGIVCAEKTDYWEDVLSSYASVYLEEEIRAEAAVREVGRFAKFLQLAALESGRIVNYMKVAQELGVSHNTVAAYYQILEDSLLALPVPAYSPATTRKRLVRSPKVLFFDLGVRRHCAQELVSHDPNQLGRWFEQWVGLELLRHQNQTSSMWTVKFWRDHNGAEVDYVLEQEGLLIPIEVKYTQHPSAKDALHLKRFMSLYPQAKKSYVICRCDTPRVLDDNIIALPWQRLLDIFEI